MIRAAIAIVIVIVLLAIFAPTLTIFEDGSAVIVLHNLGS